VVSYDNLIVTSIIVIAKVIRMQRGPFDLLGSEPQKVNKLVVQDLTLFMICEVVHEQF
jgi:hypothetical protein